MLESFAKESHLSPFFTGSKEIVQAKKYEFTGTKKMTQGKEFHQIRSLRELRTDSFFVPAGTVGGWIEKEENLSHEGGCWIDADSFVSDDSCVTGNILVENSSRVSGNSLLMGSGTLNEATLNDVYVNGHLVLMESISVSNSYLEGYVEVVLGEIENIKINQIGKERLSLIGCFIKNPNQPLYIKNVGDKSLYLRDVTLSFQSNPSPLSSKIHAHGSITKLVAEELRGLSLCSEIQMENVVMYQSFFSTNLSSTVTVIGTEEEPVTIREGGFFLTDCNLQGNGINLSGHLFLNHVEMRDASSIENNYKEKLMVEFSELRDSSKIIRESEPSTLINLKLSQDDVYII